DPHQPRGPHDAEAPALQPHRGQQDHGEHAEPARDAHQRQPQQLAHTGTVRSSPGRGPHRPAPTSAGAAMTPAAPRVRPAPRAASVSPGCRAVGTGHYRPRRVTTNQDLEQLVETSDEWIRQRTGIESRRIAAEGEGVPQMATEAARAALADAGA